MKSTLKAPFIALIILTAPMICKAQSTLKTTSSNLAKVMFAPVIMEDSNALKLTIRFENPGDEKVDIIFRSETGDEWLHTVKERSYSKIFDLSLLDDGDYTVSITRGKDRVTKKIKLFTNTYTVRTKTLF